MEKKKRKKDKEAADSGSALSISSEKAHKEQVRDDVCTENHKKRKTVVEGEGENNSKKTELSTKADPFSHPPTDTNDEVKKKKKKKKKNTVTVVRGPLAQMS